MILAQARRKLLQVAEHEIRVGLQRVGLAGGSSSDATMTERRILIVAVRNVIGTHARPVTVL